jgi:hypothetical protein
MSLSVPLVGNQRLLQVLIAGWGSLTMHLYQNNVTPSPGTVLGNLTEATFPGYSPQAVSNWAAPAPDGSGVRYMTQATAVTFTFTGTGATNNIYGYYITDASNNLLWAEYFAGAPIVMQNPGQQIQVTPVFTDRSEY